MPPVAWQSQFHGVRRLGARRFHGLRVARSAMDN
jgi:hypothetical protein